MCYSSVSQKEWEARAEQQLVMQQLFIKRAENIETLQKFGLINIWTAAEVRQTELCQRVRDAQFGFN